MGGREGEKEEGKGERLCRLSGKRNSKKWGRGNEKFPIHPCQSHQLIRIKPDTSLVCMLLVHDPDCSGLS